MKPNLADYITVAERIAAFYAKFPEGSLRSEIVFDDGKRVVMKSFAYRDRDDPAPAIGHAEEIRGDGPVNKTSALENAETSSTGRAIAMLGFEVKKGIASREEVEQAIAEEKRQDGEPKTDTWEATMRIRIQAFDLVDKTKMKLTSMGVEKLEGLTAQQAKELEKWIDETAKATVEG